MLKQAKKYNVTLIKGDTSKYKFSKEVDKVISTYSISMIDNWKESITNVKKVLKKDGRFVILDFYQWKGMLKPFYPSFRLWLNKHEVDTEKEIIKFMKENFKEVKVIVLNSGYNFIMVADKPKK